MTRQPKTLFPPGWPDNTGHSFEQGLARDRQALTAFLFLGVVIAALFMLVIAIGLAFF